MAGRMRSLAAGFPRLAAVALLAGVPLVAPAAEPRTLREPPASTQRSITTDPIVVSGPQTQHASTHRAMTTAPIVVTGTHR